MTKLQAIDPKMLRIGEEKGLLSQKVIDREKNRLIKYYQRKLKDGKTSFMIKNERDILTSVNRCIDKSLKGWNRAPIKDSPEQTFVYRLRFLTKYDKDEKIWTNKEKETLFVEHLTENEKFQASQKKKFVETKKETSVYIPTDPSIIEDTFEGRFLEIYDPEELAFYNRRKKIYTSEFEFNSSSDLSLLEAVLSDELLLRRLSNEQIKGKKDYVDKNIDDIQKRLRENQKSLGVTRAQRVAEDSNQKGNVAQLSESLDKKLLEIRNLKDIDKRTKVIETIITEFSGIEVKDILFLAQELEMLRKRALRPDIETTSPISSINQIPDFVDIEKILDGKSEDLLQNE